MFATPRNPVGRYFFAMIVTTACVVSPATLADVPASQQAEVAHLLNYVRNSDCTMNRNGSKHQGAEAVDHIQRKYNYFRDDIESTEQFIELSATKSTMSGKRYTVECPGEPALESQTWLLNELARFRTAQSAS